MEEQIQGFMIFDGHTQTQYYEQDFEIYFLFFFFFFKFKQRKPRPCQCLDISLQLAGIFTIFFSIFSFILVLIEYI